MIVKDFEVIPFVIPMSKPLKWAAGSMTEVRALLLKIEAEDGTYGVSEAVPRPMIYGETMESMYYALKNYFAPLVIGEDSFALERIWEKMGAIVWNPAAKGAIDIALHDLNGKSIGMPIYRMLGGPYRDKVELVWMVGLMSNEEMVAEMLEKAAEGFKSFKVKGGIDPQNDIDLLLQMHEKAPKGVKLYIDANMGYDRETAYRVIHALEDVLDCVEEPMPAWDDDGRAALSKQVNVPMLGDESVFTFADVYRQVRLGALKRIGIKVPRTGFTVSGKIVRLAEAADMKIQICTQAETTLGTAACLQLAAAYKQICMPCEMTFYLDVCDSLIKNELVISDGAMELPTGPGLGVEVDWDKVDKYAVKI